MKAKIKSFIFRRKYAGSSYYRTKAFGVESFCEGGLRLIRPLPLYPLPDAVRVRFTLVKPKGSRQGSWAHLLSNSMKYHPSWSVRGLTIVTTGGQDRLLDEQVPLRKGFRQAWLKLEKA